LAVTIFVGKAMWVVMAPCHHFQLPLPVAAPITISAVAMINSFFFMLAISRSQVQQAHVSVRSRVPLYVVGHHFGSA